MDLRKLLWWMAGWLAGWLTGYMAELQFHVLLSTIKHKMFKRHPQDTLKDFLKGFK